jgi:hypothetical protein
VAVRGTCWGDEPGRAHSSAGRAASGRASSASWPSKTSGGGGEERETLKGSGSAGVAGLWMGTTRAALPRGGARATLLEKDEDDDEGARRDGEGGGRRRWEGPAAAVAGDRALRRRSARAAAAGRDHSQGPQELRAHAEPAARHQVGACPPYPAVSHFFI